MGTHLEDLPPFSLLALAVDHYLGDKRGRRRYAYEETQRINRKRR